MSYKDALKVLKDMEAKFDKQRVGLQEIKPVTFFEYADIYLDYAKANKAYNSWRRDKVSLNALTPYFGNMLLEAIGSQNIELYKAKRQKEGIKPRTINIELLCLSNMLRKAIEWDYLSHMPQIKLLKQERKSSRFLSLDEMEKLLEYASPWMKPMLLVLRNTGLRSCELVNLKWADVDFTTNMLIVRNQKGNDYHSISMNEELRATLLFLRDTYITPQEKIMPREENQREYVFCFPDGKGIFNFKTGFRKAVIRAGLNGVTPHTMRHTFASHLIMSGEGLRTVQYLLGHKHIATTMIYAHLSTQHIAQAVEKLPWAKPKVKLASE